MPILPSGIAQSLGAAPQVERAAAAKHAVRRQGGQGAVRRRDDDELIVGTDGVESAQAVRRPPGNGEEESRGERQARSGYAPDGRRRTEDRPNLDIRG